MSSGFVEKTKTSKTRRWMGGGTGLTQSGGGEERSWPGVTKSGPSCMSAGG